MLSLVDSISDFDPARHNGVVVTGSHSGLGIPRYLAGGVISGLLANDAGIGREEAGVTALAQLEDCGLAVAAVFHTSARIGHALDTLQLGIVNRANSVAKEAGVAPGMPGWLAARLMGSRRPVQVTGAVSPVGCRRFLDVEGDRVILVDSASDVLPDDAGLIVITGSHGGLVGGETLRCLRARALAAVFNDAGRGLGDAGISRLPALDTFGVAGIAVSSDSARIGSAQSTFEDGVVSATNEVAADLGVTPGMSVRQLVARLLLS